jgi:hypothetical protein
MCSTVTLSEVSLSWLVKAKGVARPRKFKASISWKMSVSG